MVWRLLINNGETSQIEIVQSPSVCLSHFHTQKWFWGALLIHLFIISVPPAIMSPGSPHVSPWKRQTALNQVSALRIDCFSHFVCVCEFSLCISVNVQSGLLYTVVFISVCLYCKLFISRSVQIHRSSQMETIWILRNYVFAGNKKKNCWKFKVRCSNFKISKFHTLFSNIFLKVCPKSHTYALFYAILKYK